MKSYSFIFLLFFSASLFALNEKSIIHGTAVTSDGQWNAVSVLNDDVHDLDTGKASGFTAPMLTGIFLSA